MKPWRFKRETVFETTVLIERILWPAIGGYVLSGVKKISLPGDTGYDII